MERIFIKQVLSRLYKIRAFNLSKSPLYMLGGLFASALFLIAIPYIWDLNLLTLCRRVSVPLVGVMIILYLFYVVLRTWRLKKLLSEQGEEITIAWLFNVVASSNLIGQFTVGNVGELTRVAALKRRLKVSSYKDLMSIFVIEKTGDIAVLGIMSLSAVFLLLFFVIRSYDVTYIAILSLMLFLVATSVFSYFIFKRKRRLLDNGLIVLLTFSSVLVIFGMVVAAYICFTDVSIMTIFILHFICVVVGMISFVPGGRGAADLTQVSMAVGIFQMDPSKVAEAILHVIISGIGGSIFAAALGWVFVWIGGLSENKSF